MAAEKGRHPQLLNAVMEINNDRRPMVIKRLEDMIGDLKDKTIGLLGLSFKPNTDDMRDAPSIDLARFLDELGARVRAYDPVAMQVAAPLMPKVEMASDSYTLAQGCDALIVVTEWNEFIHLDMERIRDIMKQPIILDGRNIYDPEMMSKLGIKYRGVGRGYNGARMNGEADHEILATPSSVN
jgi:UDPglucose 6-dehydrogenase